MLLFWILLNLYFLAVFWSSLCCGSIPPRVTNYRPSTSWVFRRWNKCKWQATTSWPDAYGDKKTRIKSTYSFSGTHFIDWLVPLLLVILLCPFKEFLSALVLLVPCYWYALDYCCVLSCCHFAWRCRLLISSDKTLKK